MKIWHTPTIVGALAMLATTSFATEVPRGTYVTLNFRQELHSQDARAGDHVRLEVAHDVVVHNKVILAAGTHVDATIEKVDKRSVFGKNASIRLVLNPVDGIPLQPRSKGNVAKGSRTDHAAEIAGGGLLLLGPVGLVGGLFVKGKNVNIHPGDHLETEVSRTVDVH